MQVFRGSIPVALSRGVPARFFPLRVFWAGALLAGSLGAQSYLGGVRGTITDVQGAALPNVKVTLLNAGTGAVRSTVSNAEGSYVFSDINPAT